MKLRLEAVGVRLTKAKAEKQEAQLAHDNAKERVAKCCFIHKKNATLRTPEDMEWINANPALEVIFYLRSTLKPVLLGLERTRKSCIQEIG